MDLIQNAHDFLCDDIPTRLFFQRSHNSQIHVVVVDVSINLISPEQDKPQKGVNIPSLVL